MKPAILLIVKLPLVAANVHAFVPAVNVVVPLTVV